MIWKKLIPLLAIVLFFSSTGNAGAINQLENSHLFKVKAISAGNTTEWIYISGKPAVKKVNGAIALKGEQAEEEMAALFVKMGIDSHAKAENLVSALKREGYSTIDRMDVRWIDGDQALFSWVWEP